VDGLALREEVRLLASCSLRGVQELQRCACWGAAEADAKLNLAAAAAAAAPKQQQQQAQHIVDLHAQGQSSDVTGVVM
jgi:hypothetical protein